MAIQVLCKSILGIIVSCLISVSLGNEGILVYRTQGDHSVEKALQTLIKAIDGEKKLREYCVNTFCCGDNGFTKNSAHANGPIFGHDDKDDCATELLTDARKTRNFCRENFVASLKVCSHPIGANQAILCCNGNCTGENFTATDSYSTIETSDVTDDYSSSEPYSRSDFNKYASCSELYNAGYTTSRTYTIYPKTVTGSEQVTVYCDMDTANGGGGWTVFQRRGEFPGSHENFYRNWNAYENGFGQLDKEFWLGNKYLHLLTAQEDTILRVELQDANGTKYIANYNVFRVSSPDNRYLLEVGKFSGNNLRDSLVYSNGCSFQTYDRKSSENCPEKFKSGWWFKSCTLTNLNGEYVKPGYNRGIYYGIHWATLGQEKSLKATEMKLRAKDFKP